MRTQDSEPDIDPFLCHCGPCKQFWKDTFHDRNNILCKPAAQRTAVTSMIVEDVNKKENHPAILKIGDRVLVNGTLTGVVKYVGTLDDNLIAPGCYVGVHLDDQVDSPHNGVYKGRRYFHCPRGHGAFVHYQQVVKINPGVKRPPVSGNAMYPAYRELQQQRKLRQQMDPNMDWCIRRKETVIHSSDPDDIALQDQKRAELQSKKERSSQQSQATTESEQASRQERRKWVSRLGGGERAERLGATLEKLQLAYEQADGGGGEDSDKSRRARTAMPGSRRVKTGHH